MKKLVPAILILVLAVSIYFAWPAMAYMIANIVAVSAQLPPELRSSNAVITEVLSGEGLYPHHQSITMAAGSTVAVGFTCNIPGEVISLEVEQNQLWRVSAPLSVGPIAAGETLPVILLITAPRKANACNIMIRATNEAGASGNAVMSLRAK